MLGGNAIVRMIVVTSLLIALTCTPSLFAGSVVLSTDNLATQLQIDATQKIRARAGYDDEAVRLVTAPRVDELREYFYSSAISAVTHRRVSFLEVKGSKAAQAVVSIGDRLPDNFATLPEWLKRTINHTRHTVLILSSQQPASLKVIVQEIDRIAEHHQKKAFGTVPAKYDKVANILIDAAYPVTESYETILALLNIKEDALLKHYYERMQKGPGGRVDFFERLAVLRGDKTRNGGSLSVDPKTDTSVVLSAERLQIAGVCSKEGVKDLANVLAGAEYFDEIGALIKKQSLTHNDFLTMSDEDKARSVLVCTGGGDCAGLNEAIRNMIISLDKHNRQHGTNYRLIGIKNAFEGASSKQFGDYLVDLMPSDDPLIFAHAIAGFPSTILGSARVKLSGEKNRPLLEQTLLNLKGFAGILPTGGNDHLEVAETLAKNGVRAVAIPKSVDNDAQTEMLGFYSAIATARHVYDTTNINKGVMVFEIMGRAAGWLSMEAASKKGIILVPEEPISILTLVQRIKHEQSLHDVVKIMCSEGFSLSVQDPLLVDLLSKEPVLAIKYFTAIDKNSPEVIARRSKDLQFEALAKDYEVYLNMTPTLDPHGNPQLTGASQYVNAIVRRFIGVEPYHTDIGFALRGLSPVNHDQLMAQYYAERAVNILLDQSQKAGVAVTLPFKHSAEEPKRENIEVKQIEAVTPQKTLLTEYDSMERAEYGITIDLFFTFFDAYQNLNEKKLLVMLTDPKRSQLEVWSRLYEIALRYANNENRFDLMHDVFTVSELQQVMRDESMKAWEQLIEEIRIMGMALKKNYLFSRIKATRSFSQEELQTMSAFLDQYMTQRISYDDIAQTLRDFDIALDLEEVEKVFHAFVALQLELFKPANKGRGAVAAKGSEGDTRREPSEQFTQKADAPLDELLMCVNEQGIIQNVKPKWAFKSADRMAVEVTAVVVKDQPNKIVLFKRAAGLDQAGQLLFQSGNFNSQDMRPSQFGKALGFENISKGVKREIEEELSIEVRAEDIIQLGDFNQQRPDRKYNFKFYLAALRLTTEQIKGFALDSSIEYVQMVDVSNDPKVVNPECDLVFQEMFRLLNEMSLWDQPRARVKVAIELPVKGAITVEPSLVAIKGVKPILDYGNMTFASIFKSADALLPREVLSYYINSVHSLALQDPKVQALSDFQQVLQVFNIPLSLQSAIERGEVPFTWLNAPEEKQMAFNWIDSFFKVSMEQAAQEKKLQTGEIRLAVKKALSLWTALIKMKGPEGTPNYLLQNMDIATAMYLQKACVAFVLNGPVTLASEDLKTAHNRNQAALYSLLQANILPETATDDHLQNLLKLSILAGYHFPAPQLFKESEKLEVAIMDMQEAEMTLLDIDMRQAMFAKLPKTGEISVVLDDNFESVFDIALFQGLLKKYPRLKVNFIINAVPVSINISKATFDQVVKDKYFTLLRQYIVEGRSTLLVENSPLDSFKVSMLSDASQAALKRSQFAYVKGQNFFETFDNSLCDVVYAFNAISDNAVALTGVRKEGAILAYVKKGMKRFSISKSGIIESTLRNYVFAEQENKNIVVVFTGSTAEPINSYLSA